MRYFEIQIGGAIPINYTTYVNGQTDPGAVRVELDIGIRGFAVPFQGSKVRIWGTGIQQISSATQLNLAPIKVFGGLKPGLPLATAAFNNGQSGLLASGIIWQPYGNWIGTMQTLELPLLPGLADGTNVTQSNVANILLQWPKGTPLDGPIANCLKVAYPSAQVSVNIHPNLVLSQDYIQKYPSVFALAADLMQITQPIVGGNYPGVDIKFINGGFQVYDNTSPPAAKPILFQDLIGQPTWIDYPAIQFTTAMRADLSIGSLVTLPQGQYTTQSGTSLSTQRSNTAQVGTWMINQIHHVGDSRQPGAASWVSVFNALPHVQ